jgi:hypothetical protein
MPVTNVSQIERFAVLSGAAFPNELAERLHAVEDDPAAVRAILQRVPVGYPILIDTPGPADAGVRLGNPKGVLPYSILVSADGRLLKQHIGPFRPGDLEDWTRP